MPAMGLLHRLELLGPGGALKLRLPGLIGHAVDGLAALVLADATPLASASSFIQLDRQLRQKPARFIRSMFWTSVRLRRCSTRRRKTAASSSVLVLSSIVMAVIPQVVPEHIDIRWELSQILPHRRANGSDRVRIWPSRIVENALPPLTAPAGHAKSSMI